MKSLLHGTQYDELKEVSDKIVKEMTERDDIINVHPVSKIMLRSLH